jgi:hypothetical protein
VSSTDLARHGFSMVQARPFVLPCDMALTEPEKKMERRHL